MRGLATVRAGELRPSHEGAYWYLDRAARLCSKAGFKRILLRGDTDFTQTRRLDGWDKAGYRFLFGIDARSNLVDIAENLDKTRWKRLKRPAKPQAGGTRRTAREQWHTGVMTRLRSYKRGAVYNR